MLVAHIEKFLCYNVQSNVIFPAKNDAIGVLSFITAVLLPTSISYLVIPNSLFFTGSVTIYFVCNVDVFLISQIPTFPTVGLGGCSIWLKPTIHAILQLF